MPEMPNLAEAIALPPEEAIAWFRRKGFAISWNWQETLAEANARAFTVAKVTSLDLLKTIRAGVDNALAEGKTERWFVKTLTPLLQQAGWWGSFETDTGDGGAKRVQLGSPKRLKLIYRQNLQTAYNAGRWQEQLALREARPYLQYVAVMDSRTRESHKALNGKVFAFDDAIWQSHYPPNGWGCRCRVRQLSEFALKRRGLTVETSEGRLVQKRMLAGTDYQTGADTFTQVTGVKTLGRNGQPTTLFFTDPGFSYNPGAASHFPDLDRYPPDVARQYVRGALTGPDFAFWYQFRKRWIADKAAENPGLSSAQLLGLDVVKKALVNRARFPVAVLPESVQERLGATTRVVSISDETLIKQLVNRGQQLGLDDYFRVQTVLEAPDLVVQERDLHLMFYKLEGRIFLAVVRVTKGGDEVFLQSFRRASASELRKAGSPA